MLNTKSVFFSDKGITLSSTSANHVANLAKEFVKWQNQDIQSLEFCDKTASVLGSDTRTCLRKGAGKEALDSIDQKLEEIGEAYALIAWLREAIREKDNLLDKVKYSSIEEYYEWTGTPVPQATTLDSYLKQLGIDPDDNGIEQPDMKPTSKDDVLRLQPMDFQLRHATLTTQAQHLNDLSCTLVDKMAEYKSLQQTPQQKSDDLTYVYTPNVDLAQLEAQIAQVHAMLESVVGQLDQMDETLDQTIQKNTLDNNAAMQLHEDKLEQWQDRYDNAVDNFNTSVSRQYANALQKDRADHKTFIIKKCKEIGDLKIVIPDQLLSIYGKVTAKK